MPRSGERVCVDLESDNARTELLKYAEAAVEPFKANWPEALMHKFDLKEAKKLVAKKTDEEESGA